MLPIFVLMKCDFAVFRRNINDLLVRWRAAVDSSPYPLAGNYGLMQRWKPTWKNTLRQRTIYEMEDPENPGADTPGLTHEAA